nr:unnamed protein product [Digitaria exilis]
MAICTAYELRLTTGSGGRSPASAKPPVQRRTSASASAAICLPAVRSALASSGGGGRVAEARRASISLTAPPALLRPTLAATLASPAMSAPGLSRCLLSSDTQKS